MWADVAAKLRSGLLLLLAPEFDRFLGQARGRNVGSPHRSA
jgi:hypothetical protein